jgi:molecular chaperone DnaJ
MPDRDFYTVLGVARSASQDEIKRAYRKLARQYHPDVNPGDKAAERKFKEIQEAYDVIGDAEKRKKYDQFGQAAFEPGGPGGTRAWSFRWGGRPGQGRSFEGADFGGFDFSQIFGDAYQGGGPFASAPGRRQPAGRDIEQQVEIPFLVSVQGGDVQLIVERDRPCARCHGSGADPGADVVTCPACGGAGQRSMGGPLGMPCEMCGGAGRRPERPCATCQGSGVTHARETITAKIPAGVTEGAKIRLKGQGATATGGRAGDLYLLARIAPHPFFRREADDIVVAVPITVSEAALGTKIDVPTIDGMVTMKVPAGSSSGQRLRIRGRGIRRPDGSRSDQYVEIKIVLPPQMDDESRELLKRFGERNPHNPRDSLSV